MHHIGRCARRPSAGWRGGWDRPRPEWYRGARYLCWWRRRRTEAQEGSRLPSGGLALGCGAPLASRHRRTSGSPASHTLVARCRVPATQCACAAYHRLARATGALYTRYWAKLRSTVTPTHLQSYLEEFTVRFDRRSSGSRGFVFRRLVEQAVVAGPLTEAELTFGYDRSGSQGRSS